MNINILKPAQDDLIEGFQFYEIQNKGLGNYFLDSLFSDIDSLIIYAGIHQVYNKQFFQMQSKRFPFSIYYKVDNKMIKIHAVLDSRRKPAWIRNKIDNL